MARAMAAVSWGSNISAASPATSGSDEEFEQATGTPRLIASSTGRPKPSWSEGSTKQVAAPNSASRSASSTWSRKHTRSDTPSARARSRSSSSCGVGSPASTKTGGGSAEHRGAASISRIRFLCGRFAPTLKTIGPDGMPSRSRTSPGGGSSRSPASTPRCVTSILPRSTPSVCAMSSRAASEIVITLSARLRRQRTEHPHGESRNPRHRLVVHPDHVEQRDHVRRSRQERRGNGSEAVHDVRAPPRRDSGNPGQLGEQPPRPREAAHGQPHPFDLPCPRL